MKKKKKEIVYIPIEKLHPNLNNPRRSNGCIKELADSIKANGVLQNLTVVPGTGRYMNEYVVVAGHRRLAAAKAVGLTELPCVVEKLTKVQQIDIMLAENEQRNDLTYIERSNGYQLSLDMHDSISDVASATGTSETTVRRYLKLQKISEDKREKLHKAESEGVQINIIDYEKVADIKDDELREQAADFLGKNNFDFNLSNAKREFDRKQMLANIEAALKDNGFKYTNVKTNLRYVGYAGNVEAVSEYAEKYSDCDLFYIFEYGYYYIYRSLSDEEKSESKTTTNAEAEVTNKLNERKEALNVLKERLYNRRKDFVVSLDSFKGMEAEVIAFALAVFSDDYIDLSDLEEITGTSYFIEDAEDENDEYYRMVYDSFIEDAKQNPYKILFISAWRTLDCITKGYHNSLKPCDDNELDFLYEVLEKFGYEMSEEELQYKNGTHNLFEEG